MAEAAITHRVFKESGYIFIRKHEDTKAYPAVADMTSMTEAEADAITAYVKELASEENWLGLLKGGYSFASTITPLSDQDDMGLLKVDDIQDEEANSTFSLWNVNTKTVEKIYPMAAYAENTAKKLKLASIGGKANKRDDTYDILFVHPDTEEGDICIYSIGKNITGLTIDFKPGAVTPVPCTYAAQTIDGTGILAKVTEHDPADRIFKPSAGSAAAAAAAELEKASSGTASKSSNLFA